MSTDCELKRLLKIPAKIWHSFRYLDFFYPAFLYIFSPATNLIIKSNGEKPKAMWILPDDFTNQMQLLSTAVTTGLETIDILTIFLKQSKSILEKEIPLSLLIFRCSNISRSTHCSALMWYKPIKEKVTYNLNCWHDMSWGSLYVSWLKC